LVVDEKNDKNGEYLDMTRSCPIIPRSEVKGGIIG